MERPTYTKTILSSIVDLAFREISEDPKRGIRKMVDMGRHFTAGSFQERFFTAAQDMLSNEDSAYYGLVHKAVTTVDQETLKTFGITVGWESWAVGSKEIRAHTTERGFQTPWSFSAVIGPDTELPLLSARMDEALTLHMCCFFLFVRPDAPIDALLPLLTDRRTDAVLLFLPAPLATPERLDAIAACHKILLMFDTGRDGWKDACAACRARNMLYCQFTFYDSPETAAPILSGDWMRAIESASGIITMTVPAPDCPAETRAAVRNYVVTRRREQCFPTVLLDYDADNRMIDRIVSEHENLLLYREDGSVPGEPPIPDALRLPLAQLLRMRFPEK